MVKANRAYYSDTYIQNLGTAVNMSDNSSKSGNTTGSPWDARAYFRDLLSRDPSQFSDANKSSILAEKFINPIIDETWAIAHPNDKPFMGAKLVHHHVGQGGYAIAMPEPIHVGLNNVLHTKGVDVSANAAAGNAQVEAYQQAAKKGASAATLNILSRIGKILLIAGIAVSVTQVAAAADPNKEVAVQTGSFAAGAAGGAGGVWLGAKLFGTPGSAAGPWGAFAFGLAGGVAGGILGEKVMQGLIPPTRLPQIQYGPYFPADATGVRR